jgi:quercetin dioxygenase-like cupin family protein
MEEIGRRSALALGLAATATPALVASRAPMAQAYGPDEGKGIAPGVREIEVSQREAIIPGYKTVKMLDFVFQPGSHGPQETMESDMVCLMTEGELRVVQNGQEFKIKKGDVYTCATGTTEEDWNEGHVAAVMRVILLLPA